MLTQLKKFAPAFMLMFAMTLAFAFTPAKHQQKNVMAERFFTYTSSGFTEQTGDPSDFDCNGGDELCGIIIPDGASTNQVNAALNYASSNYDAASHQGQVSVPVSGESNILVTVVKKEQQ